MSSFLKEKRFRSHCSVLNVSIIAFYEQTLSSQGEENYKFKGFLNVFPMFLNSQCPNVISQLFYERLHICDTGLTFVLYYFNCRRLHNEVSLTYYSSACFAFMSITIVYGKFLFLNQMFANMYVRIACSRVVCFRCLMLYSLC